MVLRHVNPERSTSGMGYLSLEPCEIEISSIYRSTVSKGPLEFLDTLGSAEQAFLKKYLPCNPNPAYPCIHIIVYVYVYTI